MSSQLCGRAGGGLAAGRPGRTATPATFASADRHRHFPRHGSHQHAPPPVNAVPQHRAATLRPEHSATLRNLAQGTATLRPEQLEQRRGSSPIAAPAGLPALARLPALPRSLARQLAAMRRQQRRDAAAPAQDEEGLSRDALTLVLLATAVSFICSIDRAAMSVAILPMSDQFNWDDSIKVGPVVAQGSVASAFFAGYVITNISGGFLATRYSAKGVLALGVVLWSMFTIGTPTAAAGTVGELMLARAMMGVGEGVTYPSIQNLVRKAVPESKRSRALAFIYSGHQLGTIGSYLLCPLLIAKFGWESVFWIFGSLGFVWLLGWQPLVRDDAPPAAAVAAPPAEAADSAAPAAAAAPPPALRLQDVPWADFARNKAFWAIVAAQCTVSVGNVLAFSWLPTFYSQVYGVDVAASSAYSVLPFIVTVFATNAGGWIADGLVNNKVLDKTSTRKLMQAIASLGPAACLIKLAADQGGGSVPSLDSAVVLVTAWVSLCGFSAAGYGSNHQDISKQYCGVLYGLSNGLASVAASVSIYATGQVLHATHDWSLVFEVAAGLYAMGALAYLGFASCDEQFASAEAAGAPAGAAAGNGPAFKASKSQ